MQRGVRSGGVERNGPDEGACLLVKRPPKNSDPLSISRRVNTIGQQDIDRTREPITSGVDVHWVDPQRCSGKAEVSKGSSAEGATSGATLGGDIESKRAGAGMGGASSV